MNYRCHIGQLAKNINRVLSLQKYQWPHARLWKFEAQAQFMHTDIFFKGKPQCLIFVWRCKGFLYSPPSNLSDPTYRLVWQTTHVQCRVTPLENFSNIKVGCVWYLILKGLFTLTILLNNIFNHSHPYFQGTLKSKEFGTLKSILLHP